MVKRAVVLVLAALMGTVALVGPLPPVGAREAGEPVTFVAMSGTAGDFVTRGQSHFWGPGAVALSGSPAAGTVSVHVAGGAAGGGFDLDFASVEGEPLVVGQYDAAQRTPFRDPGHPGIDIGGDGRGCNEIQGRFTVRDLAPDLSRLWITFEQHCGYTHEAAFGEIQVNLPSDGSGLVAAPSRVGWPALAARSASAVPVRLQNTGDVRTTVTSATVSSDSEVFSVVDNGCGVLEPGASCRVVVRFAPDLAGDYGGSLLVVDATGRSHTVPLTGSAFTGPVTGRITTDHRSYDYGTEARITATLSGSYVDPTVSIYRKLPGAHTELVTRQGVDAHGRVVFSTPLKESAVFTMAWSDGDVRGSDWIEARLRPVVVTIKRPSRIFVYGDRVPLTVSLKGAPDRQVAVYRTVGDAPPVLVARPTVRTSGAVVVPVRARTNATYTARWEDAGVVRATDSTLLTVRAAVRLSPHGFVRKAGGYHLYQPGSRIVLRAAVSPDKTGKCLGVGVDVFVGVWRHVVDTRCITLSAGSRAGLFLSYDKALIGRRLRFLVTYRGDRLSYSSNPTWVYARYTR